MKKTFWIILIITIANSFGLSQKTSSILSDLAEPITLDEVIEIAINNAWNTKEAKYSRDIISMDYSVLKANLKPSISIGGQLPNFIRSSTSVTQPNGTVEFQQVSQSNASLSLLAQQEISSTGGSLFLQSDLRRFDDFTLDRQSYNGVPFRLGFIQPIFGRKPLLWQKRIIPVQQKEADRQLQVDIEAARLQTVVLYYDVIIAQENEKIASINSKVNENLLKIAEKRLELGKISLDEKLQLEIETENAKLNLQQAKRQVLTAKNNLEAFIGSAILVDSFSTNKSNQKLLISDIQAIENAKKYRPELIGFQKQLLEAERNIHFTKIDFGPQLDLFASFGFARGSQFLNDIYTDPFTEQQVSVNLQIPLVDWGRKKALVKQTQLQKNIIQGQFDQEIRNLEFTVQSKVQEFLTNQKTIETQEKIMNLAEKRFQIANERYILGAMDITDLTLAQREKDSTKRNYILALSNYWISYYELRLLTGYDYINNKMIN